MHVLQTLLTQASVVLSERLEGDNRRDENHPGIPCQHQTAPDAEQWLAPSSPEGGCA